MSRSNIQESIAKILWKTRQEELCKIANDCIDEIPWDDASDELQDIYRKMASEVIKKYIPQP